MAIVISLTEAKIRELMAGWEAVGLSQDDINALIQQLKNDQEAVDDILNDFNVSVDQLREDLASGSILVSELNDVTLPQLQLDLEQAQLDLLNVMNVEIPSLQEGLDNEITNAIDRPKVYVQEEPPENPDEEERYLVVGDTWFDSDDNNFQRIWDGVEWTTFTIDIPDLSLTAIKFKTNTHMIF